MRQVGRVVLCLITLCAGAKASHPDGLRCEAHIAASTGLRTYRSVRIFRDEPWFPRLELREGEGSYPNPYPGTLLVSGDTTSDPSLPPIADFRFSQALLKPVPRAIDPYDLASTGGTTLRGLYARLPRDATEEDLRRTFRDVPLGDLLVKPGHVVVRNPSLVAELTEVFARSLRAADDSEGPMVLDVITGDDGQPVRLEVREAHHRLLALHRAHPSATIRDLPRERLEWLVDGVPLGGSGPEPNKVPVHGVPVALWGYVTIHPSKKAATLKVPANNWDLGSRTSVALSARASLGVGSEGKRYGVHFLPPFLDEEALERALSRLSALATAERLSQILVVPDRPCDATTIARIATATAGHPRLNLYLAAVDREYEWPGGFFEDIFLKRYQQLAASPNVERIP